MTLVSHPSPAETVLSRSGAPEQSSLCPPHAWRCPVIMKLDPDHVAWTCARCGAMGLSDDLALRPAP
jgi:hypothetical protein